MYPSRLVSHPQASAGPRFHLTLVRESVPRYDGSGAAPAPSARQPSPPHASAAGASTPAARAPDVAAERADELLELGDRIAELARSIQVAEAEMMRLIVDFDERRGWIEPGFSSCAEWLAWRIGVRLNAARERVRTARALAELPQASAAMAGGELSYAKARALTRVATPESEAQLLELASAGSAESLERVVRAWKAMDDARELSAEQARHRRRRFTVFVDDDGAYVVRGRLDPEVGAVLMRAVEAASDALFRKELEPAERVAGGAGTACDPAEMEPTPAQRRADAVGLLAECALAAGFVDGSRGRRADRYQVHLHVEPDTLRSDRPSGRSELDGVRVCRETARRMTCDAGLSTIEVTPGTRRPGTRRPETLAPRVTAVTSAGRRIRTVPPALRRALRARDRGCRFPGCGSRFVEAHHIRHWADGGPTELANLVLLCRRHHRAVHEQRMRVCLDRAATVVFFTAQGRALTGSPAPKATPPRRLAAAPASRNAYPGAALFSRDGDVPWRVEARAREAMDSG